MSTNEVDSGRSNQIPAVKWLIRLFWLLGIFEKKITLRGCFCIASFSLLAFEILVDGIVNWESVKSLSRVIYLPSVVLTLCKASCLIVKSKEVVNLVDMLNQFWHADDFDQETADKVNKMFDLITRIIRYYVGFILIFCVGILPLPLLDKESKTLLFTDFALCNIQENFTCWLCNYLWQSIMPFIHGVPSTVGFDLLFILSAVYVYNGCQLLHAGLQRLNSDNPLIRSHMLKKIVEQHDLIMNYVQALSRLSSKVMFLQFTLTLWSLVLCLYMMTANGLPPSFQDITYFGSLYLIFSNALFVYAYSGAIIEEEIRKVSYSIFLVEWHEKGRTNLRKDLALMIQRAQNTRALNAGKMSDLNLILFVTTLKNALSIVMLIVQMENQGEGHENSLPF